MMPTRKLIYMHSNTAEKHIICHGIDFKEFINSLEKPPENILLIKHEFVGGDFNSRSGFMHVSGAELEKLKADNIGKYGDFCWLDFENEYALDQLTRLDIAELLYFGHRHHPFSTPFFTRLQNRFAYWSHDDGWYSSIYFTDSAEMLAFISFAVSAIPKSKPLSGGKLPHETAKEMLSLSESGLLIDGADLSEAVDTFVLPIFVTGKITDMDDAISNTDMYKKNAQKRVTLRFKKRADKQPKRFWQRQH